MTSQCQFNSLLPHRLHDSTAFLLSCCFRRTGPPQHFHGCPQRETQRAKVAAVPAVVVLADGLHHVLWKLVGHTPSSLPFCGWRDHVLLECKPSACTGICLVVNHWMVGMHFSYSQQRERTSAQPLTWDPDSLVRLVSHLVEEMCQCRVDVKIMQVTAPPESIFLS